MRKHAILAVGLLTIAVSACGSSQEQGVVEQIIIREPGDPVASALSTSKDIIALGQDAFQMCTGCHVAEAGARSGAGPNLYGVVGRAAGSLEDYPYSDALTGSEITWDAASLDGFLADPSGYAPGTDMLAGAVPDDEARAAIIAYLASTSE